ncbi:MAG TPA: glycoside hydrolase family 127 protein [Clostridia bacterium]|nr:glycoside hydrolase family 127 protein [Clostridia bacterium]
MKPAELENVRITGGYWKKRCDVNRDVTLDTEYVQLRDTGRLHTFRQTWKEGEPFEPHQFWDSDIAKWIEAVAYSIIHNPDKALEEKVDEIIDEMESAQWEDGYLNSYYSVKNRSKRWTNIRFMHELYCAGHLMEAAVAYHRATGKRKFLDIMCRYADHIDSVFGREEGKLPGYPGHEEIELALVKLYKETGEERYLRLSEYFVTERGRQPHYYDWEIKHMDATWRDWEKKGTNKVYYYCQAHEPITEQNEIVGHSVRALYFLAGVADIASETGNDELLKACERLYDNMVNRRMYITGGVGDTHDIERFSYDYNLPNETAYAETCAAIASVFFCHRMLNITRDGKYADTMELALHNGIMSGISLDGRTFFYANPLEVEAKAVDEETLGIKNNMGYKRREWFGCACCPPNLARLLSSLGMYFYSYDNDSIFVNLYGDSEFSLDGVRLTQKTNYPWTEKIEINVGCDSSFVRNIALRIPGWCRKLGIKVNGNTVSPSFKKGYAYIEKTWNDGDTIELILEMPVEKIQSHPYVRHNTGKLALKRGPIVYCLEEEDNGKHLNTLFIKPSDHFNVNYDDDFLGGCAYLTGQAFKLSEEGFANTLYAPYAPEYTPVPVKAIPYAMWTNRTPGDMTVWINALK